MYNDCNMEQYGAETQAESNKARQMMRTRMCDQGHN